VPRLRSFPNPFDRTDRAARQGSRLVNGELRDRRNGIWNGTVYEAGERLRRSLARLPGGVLFQWNGGWNGAKRPAKPLAIDLRDVVVLFQSVEQMKKGTRARLARVLICSSWDV